MSKRKHKKRKERQGQLSRRKLVLMVSVLLCLTVAFGISARWRMLPGMSKPSVATPPGSFNAGSPSKEYIYAGGRLIATEEPSGSGGPAPAAPTAVAAIAISNASVNITWTGSTDTVDHYEVERAENFQGPYTTVTPNPGALATSASDAGVVAGKAYLYRVRAVNAAGQASAFSAPDLATAIIFTDSLTNTTPIRAQHLVELRQAVNAVRHLAGLPDATWTYPDPVSNPPEQRRKIYLEDITELRSSLDEALQILGLYQSYSPNPPLARGGSIYKEHFQQIRDRVQ